MSDKTADKTSGTKDAGSAAGETAALPDKAKGAAERAAIKDRYVLDAPYTWTFFGDQSPVQIDYIARVHGLPTRPLSEPFTYCDLGCGNGVTANLLAAALPQGSFTGVDLNPEHIANARRIAEAGGQENVAFVESDFGALLERDDLPDFDYITLHGVYTWVAPQVQEEIRQFIARKLKPGGLVYVSYNAMPGWAPLLPLRQIMLSYANLTEQGSLDKAVKSLRYLKFLRDNKATFFQANPAANPFLDRMLRQDPAYIAHEYFNRHWKPLYFSEVARDFAGIGMAYCGSTRVERNYTDLVVPDRFHALLKSADNEFVRETHKSLILNEIFRQDIYCRAELRKQRKPDAKLFEGCVFGATQPAGKVKREVKLGPHMIRLKDEIYDRLVPLAAPGSLTVAQLRKDKTLSAKPEAAVAKALQRLTAAQQFRPFAKPAPDPGVEVPGDYRIASATNRALLEERLFHDPAIFLAAPVLGSGLAVDLMQGLLLLSGEAAGDAGMEKEAVKRLKAGGKIWRQKVAKGAKGLDLEGLVAKQAEAFRKRSKPLLFRFGVIEAA